MYALPVGGLYISEQVHYFGGKCGDVLLYVRGVGWIGQEQVDLTGIEREAVRQVKKGSRFCRFGHLGQFLFSLSFCLTCFPVSFMAPHTYFVVSSLPSILPSATDLPF
jgi:hypothetical protein